MGYNFFIDSLGFNKAVSPDNPYQRATAPFRKDQIDTSGEAGDQSLTGWWTRGQFSFHEGSGIKYYEVLGSDNTLYRFQDSEGIDPWTTVGQVTPAFAGVGDFNDGFKMPPNARSEWQGCGAVGDNAYPWVVTMDNSFNTGVWWCPLGISSSNPVKVTTTGTEMVTSVCSDDWSNLYVTVGNRIEKISRSAQQTLFAAPPATSISSTVLWTNNYSTTSIYNYFGGVFWAKGRLWAYDMGGNWYTLDTNGGTIAAADASDVFWKSDITSAQSTDTHVNPYQFYWRFTSTPGPVYIAYQSVVYMVTVDQSTTTPTISAPVTVVDVGENIWAMGSCPGFLGLNTDSCFRVGAIASDGSITLGPPVVNWLANGAQTNSCNLASDGLTFYFIGTLNGEDVYSDWSIFEADTANLLSGTLQPAYMRRDKNPIPAGSAYVIDAHRISGPCSTQQLGWWATSDESFRDGASVTTGYHRYGTLDEKIFNSALVEVGGTGGSIDVYQVDTSGVETLLGSAAYSDKRREFPFATTGGVEAMALKFVFHNDSADNYKAPTLYGYQIKALPSPKRQRMIRVPVFMFDVEQDASGKRMGKAKDAWTRLQALEAYEEAHSIVRYQDLDTGETGTAYIESIETQVESTSSARASDRGFGGIVNITLRRIGA